MVDGLVGGRERALVALLPEQLAAGDIDAEEIVGDAGDNRDLSRASRRRHALGNQRREEVVHLARLAIELDLPQQLHVLDVGQGEDLLVLHPAGTAGIVAFGQVVGRHERDAGREHRQRQTSSKTPGRLSPGSLPAIVFMHRYDFAQSARRVSAARLVAGTAPWPFLPRRSGVCDAVRSDQNVSRTPSWITRFELARTPLIEPKAGLVCTPVAKSKVATVFTP